MYHIALSLSLYIYIYVFLYNHNKSLHTVCIFMEYSVRVAKNSLPAKISKILIQKIYMDKLGVE